LYRRGEIVLPDAETAAGLYEATAEEAARFGLLPYEVSNYAKPGSESRHNLAYWRYGDYAGIGPGAHGRLSLDGRLIATRRHRAPEIWAERVEATGHGSGEDLAVTAEERAREMLLMGLRLSEGISAARFQARTGVALSDAIEPDILAAAIEAGYLVEAGDRLRATQEGRLRLDALLGALVR
jgi:oxygen-independent coproporphyrinogen-3 oxidase